MQLLLGSEEAVQGFKSFLLILGGRSAKAGDMSDDGHLLRKGGAQGSHILRSPWEASEQEAALEVVAFQLATDELH
jgi:hypothetical protein